MRPGRWRSLLPALGLLAGLAFLSCQDNSNNDNTPMPKQVTTPSPCGGVGAGCASGAACCGFGNCNNGMCDSSSFLAGGEPCTESSQCQSHNCVASVNVGGQRCQ